ncbi:hypothetical protein GCM10007382_21820 [Salinibacterium xinjiangense]|uniref:DUF6993 domain-containing protein n=1 Tax=Salinibacterium xinjiangense TaxID=386302 RepID=A0A2C8ZXD7_9MICO|nr:hypothetical protein [Salinibacterium xinjiangense]GGL01574.1 hypothetical protein GCM10007382_21820 [Salinibacterium xinjiangense]SOE70507.1 hypothetical protein SAMN06296378_2246 [Salinibacterium xinjiangense]
MVLKRRIATATVAGFALALGLSSCVGTTGSTADSGPSTSRQPATSVPGDGAIPTPAPTPTKQPVHMAGGTAEQNKPIFDATNQRYFIDAGNVIPEGRGVIDNLVSVGFDKSAMQVTPDRTAIDLPVDSLIFSVLIGDKCLVGQFSALGYSTIVAPKLATGSCLIGLTRTIDW